MILCKLWPFVFYYAYQLRLGDVDLNCLCSRYLFYGKFVAILLSVCTLFALVPSSSWFTIPWFPTEILLEVSAYHLRHLSPFRCLTLGHGSPTLNVEQTWDCQLMDYLTVVRLRSLILGCQDIPTGVNELDQRRLRPHSLRLAVFWGCSVTCAEVPDHWSAPHHTSFRRFKRCSDLVHPSAMTEWLNSIPNDKLVFIPNHRTSVWRTLLGNFRCACSYRTHSYYVFIFLRNSKSLIPTP